jgi:preprotein translocase subunit Sec61beta
MSEGMANAPYSDEENANAMKVDPDMDHNMGMG